MQSSTRNAKDGEGIEVAEDCNDDHDWHVLLRRNPVATAESFQVIVNGCGGCKGRIASNGKAKQARAYGSKKKRIAGTLISRMVQKLDFTSGPVIILPLQKK